MPLKLYEDLYVNPETFKAAQKYWKLLTASVASSLGQAGHWHEWIPRTYADSKTPFELEDQQIWDGRSDQFDRAFRIYQGPRGDHEPGLAAWLSFIGPEWDSSLPREELVISLIFSEDTARLAEKLLRKWMNPETTFEEMKAFIEEHAPERRP